MSNPYDNFKISVPDGAMVDLTQSTTERITNGRDESIHITTAPIVSDSEICAYTVGCTVYWKNGCTSCKQPSLEFGAFASVRLAKLYMLAYLSSFAAYLTDEASKDICTVMSILKQASIFD